MNKKLYEPTTEELSGAVERLNALYDPRVWLGRGKEVSEEVKDVIRKEKGLPTRDGYRIRKDFKTGECY